jgi:hypothetical protein
MEHTDGDCNIDGLRNPKHKEDAAKNIEIEIV